tara:strand:- start:114 stop:461 length:348 start_codon:yes stop_codon:yes gene_type:complete
MKNIYRRNNPTSFKLSSENEKESGFTTESFSNINVRGVPWTKGVKGLEHISPVHTGVNVSGINLKYTVPLSKRISLSLSNPGIVYARPTIKDMPERIGKVKAFSFQPKIGLNIKF